MWKRLSLSLVVPLLALMIAGAPQAQAGVHFGVSIGVPPVYPPPGYPYVSPYPYPSEYAYPPPVYGYGYYWGGHPDRWYSGHHDRGWYGHEWHERGHERAYRDHSRNRR
jgi:hypothetical protein